MALLPVNTQSNRELIKWLKKGCHFKHLYHPKFTDDSYYFNEDNDIDLQLNDNNEANMCTSAFKFNLQNETDKLNNENVKVYDVNQVSIPQNTIHGHVSNLFQQMVDVCIDNDINYEEPIEPLITPDMKSAFYKFCNLYTTKSD
jgi:hypothetical protein